MSNRMTKLRYNTMSMLLLEVVTLISGLLLPRLILAYFGSTSNGLISSITKFLGFSTILRAGLGGAIRAALYRPIAENNSDEIDAIMAATDRHMKKISAIIAVSILGFAFVYPFFVIDEYDWLYSFSMVLIIGSGTFVGNLFGIKCQILLQADQKYYISTLISVVETVLVTAASMAVIVLGGDLHLMKVVAVLVTFVKPLLLNLYVKTHYKINWKATPNEGAISQRWNAFFQQVAAVVNENVSLVILTVLQPLASVSVYTVHAMVVTNIRAVVNSFSSGMNSTYGSMLAENRTDELRKTFFFTEWLMFAIGCVLYSITAVMLSPFITLYTDSITDINYHYPAFGILMVIGSFIGSVRLPYQYLAEGAGRFKETRNGAILEVIVNVFVSALCVIKFGIIGVLVGMLFSGLVRTVEFAIFTFKNILNTSLWHFVMHLAIASATFTACFFVGKAVAFLEYASYFEWVINAIFVSISSVVVVFAVSILFYRKELSVFLNNFKKRIKK